MLMTSFARPAFVLASLLLLAMPAAAQGTAEERSACEGDAFKFCSSDIPDIPKIEACLETNLTQLSPACQAEFDASADKKTKLQPAHFK
jgi:hypothetical protein